MFAEKARAGKNPVKASRAERLSKRSPISLWALGVILFVVLGGGASRAPFFHLRAMLIDCLFWFARLTVVFELLRLFFL